MLLSRRPHCRPFAAIPKRKILAQAAAGGRCGTTGLDDLGTSAETWMNPQATWDLDQAARRRRNAA
jgi:hypothetical protein